MVWWAATWNTGFLGSEKEKPLFRCQIQQPCKYLHSVTFSPGGISWFSWYTKISNWGYNRVSHIKIQNLSLFVGPHSVCLSRHFLVCFNFQVDENLALLQFWGAFGDCLHTQITFIYVGLLAIVPALTNCMYVPFTVNKAIQRTCLCLSVGCTFHTLDKKKCTQVL